MSTSISLSPRTESVEMKAAHVWQAALGELQLQMTKPTPIFFPQPEVDYAV